MAKYTIDSLPQIIELGRQGENGVRTITIDCSEMLERMSGASIVLRALRPGEDTPYIVDTTINDAGVLTWQPDSVDTAIAGTGRAELRCTLDDKIEKSAVFATCIKVALSDTDGEKADAPSSWTQAVLDAADRVVGINANAVTLEAGADAYVESDGKTLTFGIPKGEAGAQGIQGEKGAQGIQGEKGADGFSPKVTVTESDDGTVISVTDADGTTSATVKGGGDSVQPDWLQNDSTAKDYIRNRIAYELKRTYTWDGEAGDLPTITYDGNTYYCVEGLAVGEKFSLLTHTDFPSTVTYTWVEGGDTGTYTYNITVSRDDSTGYYTVKANNIIYAIAAWGISDTVDGIYLRKNVYDSDNGYYDFISAIVLGGITKIPGMYLPTTNEIAEDSDESITSGAIFAMPKLECLQCVAYTWDGTESDSAITYNDNTYYLIKPSSQMNMKVSKDWGVPCITYFEDDGGITSNIPQTAFIKTHVNVGSSDGFSNIYPTTIDINGTTYIAMHQNEDFSDVPLALAQDGTQNLWLTKISIDGGSVYGHQWIGLIKFVTDALTLDEMFIPTTSTATKDSITPITSGGVYAELEAIKARLAALEGGN